MIHHFYHIYADGQWEQAVEEHLKALNTGLCENLTTFNVGIVGSKVNRDNVKQFLSLRSVKCFGPDCKPYCNPTVIAEADSGWEQETMIPMHEFSKTNEGLILYAHTKGASNPSDVNIRWRRSMTYWNVIRWQTCVEQLKIHGAVGCHWIQPLLTGMPEHKQGNFMFAGTFFWTHANLMRTWNAPAMTHRHEAEGFIGYGWHQSNFPVYDHTPYFPNSGPFADSWINDPNFKGDETGKSIT